MNLSLTVALFLGVATVSTLAHIDEATSEMKNADTKSAHRKIFLPIQPDTAQSPVLTSTAPPTTSGAPAELHTTVKAQNEGDLRHGLEEYMTDFDSLEHVQKGADGSIKAKYKVMLKSANSEYKLENLLFLYHDDAVKYCEENFENGTLLTLHTAKESAEIVDWLFNKLRIPAKVWLGATKVQRLETVPSRNNAGSYSSNSQYKPLFLWDDNSGLVSFTNWHSGSGKTSTNNNYYGGYLSNRCEPSGNENCIEMLSHYYPYPVQCDTEAVAGQWNDVACNNKKKNVIVCKKLI